MIHRLLPAARFAVVGAPPMDHRHDTSVVSAELARLTVQITGMKMPSA